jgi:hypothetical protein
MSILWGGNEHKSGDLTQYLFNQRKIRLENIDDDQIKYLYREEYYFIPKEKEFCSCLLYENLIKQVAENISPSLNHIIENSPYKPDEWYKNLVILNNQLNEWPEYRAKKSPKYSELLNLQLPALYKIEIPIIKDKKWMELLYKNELLLQPDIQNFESKLCEFYKKMGDKSI